MNLLLTTVCNRRCAYCFAQGKIDYEAREQKSQFIAPDKLKIVRRFLKNSKRPRLSLLGGEPTLHPDFAQIVTGLAEKKIHVNVFTNALMPEKALEALEKMAVDQVSLTVNVNAPDQNTPKEWRRIKEVLKRLSGRVVLGFNIHQPDFNADFLVDLCKSNKLKPRIRLGLAQPVVTATNVYVDPQDYPEVGQRVVALSDRCDKYDISIGFDCGFVMCMFDESQLGRLLSNNTRIKFKCGPAIDIGPDLSVWACFPFSKVVPTHLEAHKSEDDLRNYFRDYLEPVFNNGVYDRCLDCKLRRRAQCTGGCGAHVYKRSFSNPKLTQPT